MGRARIFVDGHIGTTGLRIRELLAPRDDIELIQTAEADRKDLAARRELLNQCDLAILCLPDDGAREAVSLIENQETAVIDASTAHRTDPDWVYGLPEMDSEQRQAVAESRRVSNPGCWPTSPILALRPLIEEGILPAGSPILLHGLSGYTGGGRAMIERWEALENGLVGLPHPAPYAMERHHKHAPEMEKYTGLRAPPYFLPAVGPFPCGMRVVMPLHTEFLASGANATRIREILVERYRAEKFIRIFEFADAVNSDEFRFDPQACNGTNRLDLHVVEHPSGHVLIVGLLDNLGKGAAGAAVQNLNLMLGFDEAKGLLVDPA